LYADLTETARDFFERLFEASIAASDDGEIGKIAFISTSTVVDVEGLGLASNAALSKLQRDK